MPKPVMSEKGELDLDSSSAEDLMSVRHKVRQQDRRGLATNFADGICAAYFLVWSRGSRTQS